MILGPGAQKKPFGYGVTNHECLLISCQGQDNKFKYKKLNFKYNCVKNLFSKLFIDQPNII